MRLSRTTDIRQSLVRKSIRKLKNDFLRIFLFVGNFFASSFIMGGDRHDQTIPESYLFGENSDLNWLAPKPTAVIIRKFIKIIYWMLVLLDLVLPP